MLNLKLLSRLLFIAAATVPFILCSAALSHAKDWQTERSHMCELLAKDHGITNQRVLAAMRMVPRHLFVPAGTEQLAYKFGNIDIGSGQVIGDPYIVAFMTQSLHPKQSDIVLEIGTGSGYQAAVMSKLVKKVYSIEIEPPLARTAKARLSKLGYKNVETKRGDGYKGWPKHAPFDAIIVTSHPDHIPQTLINELKPGGLMVLPVGGKINRMQLVTRLKKGVKVENLNLTGLVLNPDMPAAVPVRQSLRNHR